jgi:enoyl-CoA hydratase/carnithine racemase
MNELVSYAVQEGVLTLTINRPDKRNALNIPVLEALKNALHQAENDPTVRVVVIKGAGNHAFSAGGDLKAFRALQGSEIAHWVNFGNAVFNQLDLLPKPTVAFIQGYALGGGLELALCCDFRIALPDAVVGCPELQHGWLPGWGGLVRLRRLLGESRAKEIAFLNPRMSAMEAHRLGLIHQIIEPDAIESTLNHFLNPLKQIDATVFVLAKQVLHDENRQTQGADLSFEVLATHYFKSAISS